MPIRAARTLRRHRPPRAAATPRVLARRRRGIAARAGRTRKLPARSSHPRSRRGTPRPALASRYAVAPPGALERPRQDQRHRPRRMQQRLQHALQAPRGQPRTTLSEGAQVGHFEQRLGRQQQGLAGHLGQVVLDQRQLRAATQRLAAPSQALRAALAITQQADGAALEKCTPPAWTSSNPAASSSTPGSPSRRRRYSCMFSEARTCRAACASGQPSGYRRSRRTGRRDGLRWPAPRWRNRVPRAAPGETPEPVRGEARAIRREPARPAPGGRARRPGRD